MNKKDVSVVIPVCNESGNIEALHASVSKNLTALGRDFEVIYIDDGSTDGTSELLKKMYEADKKHIVVITFRGNYGKSSALDCGFKRSSGDIVVTMDADIQDNPDDIGAMLKKLDEGYDLVCGWRIKRRDNMLKVFLSKMYNWSTSKLTGLSLHDFNCGFKAYRRELAAELNLYGDLHRYIPAIAKWKNFRITEMPVSHRPRTSGRSKFGTAKIFAGFLDILTIMMVTKYSQKPSRIFGYLGLMIAAIGVLIFAGLFGGHIYYLATGIVEFKLRTRPLFIIATLFILVGIQLLSLGLIAELLNIGSRKEKSIEDYNIKNILGGNSVK